jgi:hypothetical protein
MTNALRQFAEHAALSIEPVERFCAVISELPEEGQSPVVAICALALGCGLDIGDEAMESGKSTEEMLRAPALTDVRKKLIRLITQLHVLPNMLLPGLFAYLKTCLAYYASSTARHAAIDQDLDWLARMEKCKKLPAKDRPAGFETDAAIDRAIKMIQERSTKRGDEHNAAKAAYDRIENAWDKHFPDSYWQDWLHRMSESS